MQELHFTPRLRGCGESFSRSIEPPRSAPQPLTLSCGHCGCPHQVAAEDGLLRERWAARAGQPLPAASSAPVKGIPGS